MDGSLPSHGLHFQTGMANRPTLSEISRMTPNKFPFRGEKDLDDSQFFGVSVVIAIGIRTGPHLREHQK